jgi:hypothetical protein
MHMCSMVYLPTNTSSATHLIGFCSARMGEFDGQQMAHGNYLRRVRWLVLLLFANIKRIPKSECLNQRHVRDVGLRKRRCAQANKHKRLDGIDKMDQIIRAPTPTHALTPMLSCMAAAFLSPPLVSLWCALGGLGMAQAAC